MVAYCQRKYQWFITGWTQVLPLNHRSIVFFMHASVLRSVTADFLCVALAVQMISLWQYMKQASFLPAYRCLDVYPHLTVILYGYARMFV